MTTSNPKPSPLAAVADRLHPDLDEYKPAFRHELQLRRRTADDEMADLRRKAHDWQMAFFAFIPVPVGIFIFCVLLEVWP